MKKRKTGTDIDDSADIAKDVGAEMRAAADFDENEVDEDAEEEAEAADDADADPEEEFEPEEPVGEVELTGPAAAAKKDVGGRVPVEVDDEGKVLGSDDVDENDE